MHACNVHFAKKDALLWHVYQQRDWASFTDATRHTCTHRHAQTHRHMNHCTQLLQDEEYEMQLRTYQQQYEQLRAAFEREQAKMDSSARARKREKELAAQVRPLTHGICWCL